MTARFADPEPLAASHAIDGFECGAASLDTWLTKHARQAAPVGSARTYVVTDRRQERVVGYHAITAASVDRAGATARARRGMPRHPIPAVLLARLAVDRSVTRRGIGAWLVRDAMQRTLSVADVMGVRVLLVHALDDDARRFYERFGFEPSPTDPLNLQLLVKDIRVSIGDGTDQM